MAAPPPPPPSYVAQVEELLTRPAESNTIAQLSDFVAPDVQAYENDRLVAKGRAEWMRRYRSSRVTAGSVLAHNEAWDTNGGSLMIVDQFDTVNRSKLPRTFVADPRYTGRVTLYQFGTDQKIHAIRTLIGGGFWMKS